MNTGNYEEKLSQEIILKIFKNHATYKNVCLEQKREVERDIEK